MKELMTVSINELIKALRRLDWQQVQVENFGVLSKAKAIVLSRRRNNLWFDDDLLSFAKLLKEDVLPEISMEELNKILPDAEDIENLSNFSYS